MCAFDTIVTFCVDKGASKLKADDKKWNEKKRKKEN